MALLRFAMTLATRGWLSKFALLSAVLIVVGAGLAIGILSHRELAPPLAEMVTLTTSALSWGSGATLAFASSLHATRDDVQSGLVELARLRGFSEARYALSRTFGLAVVVFFVIACGAVLTAMASLAVAPRASVGAIASALRSGVLYGATFAVVVSPLAMAALGARSRLQGYLILLSLLVLPELLRPYTKTLVAPELHDLLTLPTLLGVVQRATGAGGHDIEVMRVFRALLALAFLSATSTYFIVRANRRLQLEEAR